MYVTFVVVLEGIPESMAARSGQLGTFWTTWAGRCWRGHEAAATRLWQRYLGDLSAAIHTEYVCYCIHGVSGSFVVFYGAMWVSGGAGLHTRSNILCLVRSRVRILCNRSNQYCMLLYVLRLLHS